MVLYLTMVSFGKCGETLVIMNLKSNISVSVITKKAINERQKMPETEENRGMMLLIGELLSCRTALTKVQFYCMIFVCGGLHTMMKHCSECTKSTAINSISHTVIIVQHSHIEIMKTMASFHCCIHDLFHSHLIAKGCLSLLPFLSCKTMMSLTWIFMQ